MPSATHCADLLKSWTHLRNLYCRLATLGADAGAEVAVTNSFNLGCIHPALLYRCVQAHELVHMSKYTGASCPEAYVYTHPEIDELTSCTRRLAPICCSVVVNGTVPALSRTLAGRKSCTRRDSSAVTASLLVNSWPRLSATRTTRLALHCSATCSCPCGSLNIHSCSRPCACVADRKTP